jgi:alkaline phosphatase
VDLKVHATKTILESAEQRGKATGLVSTARITHATPAANYAHSPERDWEADANQPAGCKVPDIARQMIEMPYGDGIEVAFGGGRDRFLPVEAADPEDAGKTGVRKDGRNLTTEWTGKFGTGSAFVYDQKGFDAIDPARATHVLGLFERSHMEYEADRPNDTGKEPSLAQMTDKAIRILEKNPKGFYLQVEAGRIDHGHHAGNAYRALTDTIALSDAVQKTVDTLKELGKLEDTLIVVSADHSHTFTIGGYPQRGNNILGKVIEPGSTTPKAASDKNPYTTLGYANGVGYYTNSPGDAVYSNTPRAGRIENMTDVDTTHPDFHQEVAVPLSSETHAGEEVAIYAMGPKAHLFQGTVEQNVIYHVMMNALRMKP